MSRHIGLIGKGKMGTVLFQALQGNTVTVIERGMDYNKLPWKTIDTLVLAIKPQDVPALASLLQSQAAHCLIISVMAGVSTTRLAELTNSNRIIRCMPNTPAQIGMGMIAYVCSPEVNADDLDWFKTMIERAGKSLQVDNDDWIDKATAISGSGPAYVFTFIEALTEAAKGLGFSVEQANLLVEQTILGSIGLWQHSQLPAATLREQVTSKGGTTASALVVLKDKQMLEAWQQAVQAAYERTKTL